MLLLLAVSLILCLVSVSGEGWAKKLPPKMCNKFILTSLYLSILPMVTCSFRKKIETGVLNQGTCRILLCVLSILYIEIILEATISRVFPTQMYHVEFHLVKTNCL